MSCRPVGNRTDFLISHLSLEISFGHTCPLMVWDGISFIIDSSICNVYNDVDVARIDDVDDGDVQLSSPSPSITSHLQSSSNSPHFTHFNQHCSASAGKFAHFAHVAHFVTRNPKQKSIIRVSPVIDTMMNWSRSLRCLKKSLVGGIFKMLPRQLMCLSVEWKKASRESSES